MEIALDLIAWGSMGILLGMFVNWLHSGPRDFD